MGLKPFFNSLIECKNTLKYIRVDDNKSINKAIPELCRVFEECTNLEYVNISDNSMKKSFTK